MFNLSKKEKCYALFGNLLGDGSLYSSKYIQNTHTNKKRDYVVWLESVYKRWGVFHKSRYDYVKNTTFGPCLYSSVIGKMPKTAHFLKFDRFYKKGKKVASKYILRRITPIGLLLWFLDDGTLNVSKQYRGDSYSVHRFAYLNTQGFDDKNQEKIQKMFDERFDIQTRIHTDSGKNLENKKYKRIYFNATNFRKFFDVVRPYLKHIPESMRYKFDMKYEINKLKKSSFLVANYNL